VRLDVDAWDPAYGTGFDPVGDGRGPAGQSSAAHEPDVEVPAAAWRPLTPPGDVRAPEAVLLVDGVRRIDAGVWVTDDDELTHRGLAASYAAGAVRCDLLRGAATVAGAQVRRGLFTPSPSAVDIGAGSVRYRVHRVARDEHAALVGGVQAQLQALEAEVSERARQATTPSTVDDDALLVVDGPLHRRRHLSRALGYVKTHRVEYLSPDLSRVVTRLAPGQRTPVFRIGSAWPCFAWYLRLPGAAGAPWSGIVRVECSAELTVTAAIGYADLSAVTLPRFASSPYKDPRAPQNLVPIAGLERRLRAMLGDARLLHRSLLGAARTTAAARPATAAARPAAVAAARGRA
jgi:hypothetical protein